MAMGEPLIKAVDGGRYKRLLSLAAPLEFGHETKVRIIVKGKNIASR